jgi:elongation factor P
MLKYNEIDGKYIILDGDPFKVLSSHVFRKQQRKPVNHAKLKNLITGKVVEHAFAQSDKIDEAEIGEKEIKYLYSNKGEFWFCDPNNPKDRFKIEEDNIPRGFKFIKANDLVSALIFNEKIIGFNLPIKVALRVKEAPPAVKGNTSTGANKVIVLETGATVTAPIFVNEGDMVEVNTETEEYTGRV